MDFSASSERLPKVPFVDLTSMHGHLREQMHKSLDDVLRADSLVLGSHLRLFERQFSKYVDARFCVGVSNGADALELIFRALGLSERDEVIVPSNSFFASASAVTLAGATPVFCDVGDDALINVSTASRVATSRTKAILAVHLFGQCVQMNELLKWANKKNIYVVEDAAQAHGASRNGVRAGAMGHASAFSFYPTKNLGALGDAGAITTSDRQLYEKICLLRNYGSVEKYKHSVVGRNARMDTLQAAFLSCKLPLLDDSISRRRLMAQRLTEGLRGLPLAPIKYDDANCHAFHLYVVRLEAAHLRDPLRSFLLSKNIETSVHYPTPIHKQPAYRRHAEIVLPNAEALSQEMVSLPMYPEISIDQVDHVISCIHQFWRKS